MSTRWGTTRYGTDRWWRDVSVVALSYPLSIHDRTFSANWDDDRTIALGSYTMTKTRVALTNFVIGDAKRIKRVYDDLPTGSTVALAYLTIKRSARHGDSQALVQKSITTSGAASGQITDAATTGGSIALYFDLSITDTAVFRAGVEYLYDVQIVLSTGEVHTMEVGTITWIAGVTAASS